jgi:hypothetical protein
VGWRSFSSASPSATLIRSATRRKGATPRLTRCLHSPLQVHVCTLSLWHTHCLCHRCNLQFGQWYVDGSRYHHRWVALPHSLLPAGWPVAHPEADGSGLASAASISRGCLSTDSTRTARACATAGLWAATARSPTFRATSATCAYPTAPSRTSSMESVDRSALARTTTRPHILHPHQRCPACSIRAPSSCPLPTNAVRMDHVPTIQERCPHLPTTHQRCPHVQTTRPSVRPIACAPLV